ncbi:serine/threonine-protein phosphatase 2A regulatory subunit B'' [Marchantia polymorpha subsp. ruderalis]|uniref:EF-hand domain-containing protein n=2 Tax=Marchantia polymorpha TaxID=3197 RepID=A0AAF6BI70_MARPO|nr:hypothetical protein MARPO_0032s0100 [Marchantia polymorpha]BBN11704.1 hypothetical protein Mp_5g14100 [Marchantia polymorpha subsp. ruderalis]|eukprot:PTQ41917.1 hypothetical protein MARPO_0032s0100 [Marchantia polymorpha]
MDASMAVEVGVLDPDLLQLTDLPMPATKPLQCKLRLDDLFSQWLSLPDSQRLVLSLLEDVKAGVVLSVPGGPSNGSTGASASLLPSMFPAGNTPPLSPRSTAGSPLSPKSPMKRTGSGPTATGSPLKKTSEPVKEIIPQFYFPHGPPAPKEVEEECLAKIDKLFFGHPDGLPIAAFTCVTKDVCKLPSFFSSSLYKKIDTDNTGLITKEQFLKYWTEKNMLTTDLVTRVFQVLKQPDKNYLTQDDFRPILRELLLTHHGLEFLHDTPEFQERYAETVIYRIFYHINRSGNGRLQLRELKRSNLVTALQQVDEEEDINKVLKYFSYEHFYVIYCKFWELDTDHDFLIDKDDLLRYGNHALTYRIVERIFSQVPRKFTSTVANKMGYEDFVWFILSEEDKSSEPSLEYWFKCVDLDGDGIITPNEMQYFYEEQLHRMECMAQERVLFEDIVCQMADMICPEKEGQLTLRDLKRCKLSGNFFNILFNLNKFVAFETRDPFLIRQEREDPSLTEWDRFAHQEYIRLSMEEDGEDASNGSAEVWDESLEAPF